MEFAKRILFDDKSWNNIESRVCFPCARFIIQNMTQIFYFCYSRITQRDVISITLKNNTALFVSTYKLKYFQKIVFANVNTFIEMEKLLSLLKLISFIFFFLIFNRLF